MAKKPIQQFSGMLTPEQVAYGMNAAARNAKRLYDDAVLLADASCFQSACALAILSIEESGKLAVLRRIATARNDQEVKSVWKDYRNHQVKNAAWILRRLAAEGARTLEGMREIVNPDSDHPAVLDTVKQLAFYTDCYGEAHWSEPQMVVDEKLCRTILMAARVLVPRKPVSTREVELWIKHVGPYGDRPTVDGPMAFFKAMKEEGLSDHDEKDVARFLGIGPVE